MEEKTQPPSPILANQMGHVCMYYWMQWNLPGGLCLSVKRESYLVFSHLRTSLPRT